MANIKNIKELFNLVDKYYDKNFDFLEDEKFHFASRMFFWFGDKKNYKRLAKLKKEYIGINDKEIKDKIGMLLEKNQNRKKSTILKNKIRAPFFNKYSSLKTYNRVLFKVLFCDYVYKINIRPYLKNHLMDKDLADLREKLFKDEKAMLILSTHAVNFIYNLENYFQTKTNFIKPKLLYQLAVRGVKKITPQYSPDLIIYFLTHCIIGESRFYNRKITKNLNIYLKMLKLIEEIIENNYFEISLDNKFEFLVCAKICKFKSRIEKTIMAEAVRSLSERGNFLIDKINDYSKFKKKTDLIKSEHRNILFLMSCKNWRID